MERKTGTSQTQRRQEASLLSTFLVDSRSFDDLLYFIKRYLELVIYYNEENLPDGHWSEVFTGYPIFYLIEIITADTSGLTKSNQDPAQILEQARYWNETVHRWPAELRNLDEDLLAEKILNLLDDEILNAQINLADPLKGMLPYRVNGNHVKANGSLFAPTPEIESETDNLQNLLHTYYKLVLYIQSLTRDYLQKTVFSQNNHAPDVAMFMAFVELFKNAQDEINTLPARHLDFYYREILREKTTPGVPSTAIVSVQLLPGINSSMVPEGALVTAGKIFNSKTDVLFAGQKALLALSTSLSEVETLFINKNPYVNIGTDLPAVSGIKLTPLVQTGQNLATATGMTAALFGADLALILDPETEADNSASMGFLIGSQVLYLSEGKRCIQVEFCLDSSSANATLWNLLSQIQANFDYSPEMAFGEVFDNAFLISYTTAQGWIAFNSYEIDFSQEQNTFTLTLELGFSDPAVDVFRDVYAMSWPALKIELNPYNFTYAYSFLSGLVIEKIKINVSVSNMKDISVYNSIGKVLPSKTFDFFGPVPQQYNYLMVGKAELFKKNVTDLVINITWSSIPQVNGGFPAYYSAYSNTYANDSFQLQATILSDGSWIPQNLSESPPQTMFSTVNSTDESGNPVTTLSTTQSYDVYIFDKLNVPRDFTLNDPILYNLKTQSGFIKLGLISPPQAFGTQEYTNVYASVARSNAINKTDLPYPNKPFVPKVSQITLDYSASDELNFNTTFSGDTDSSFNTGEYKHITPFGIENVMSDQTIEGNTLLASYTSEGYLVLNFSNVQFPSVLSIYFHLATPERNMETTVGAQIRWEYEQLNDWIPLPPDNILSDGTTNFIRSGIIEVILPANGSDGSNYRVRISPEGSAMSFPKLSGISMNALEVTCTSTDGQIMGQTFPAGSITAMSGNYPDIKAIVQPADSLGGRPEESDIYPRVRERLRHKERPVTVWDYERLVLRNFPEVMIAKCSNLDESFKPVPNRITVVVMSQKWSFEDQYYYCPDELAEIQVYLQQLSSPFCNIRVINPFIERLLVNCVAAFDPEDVGGYYLNLLNQEIINFLSPLSTINDTNEGIGKTVVPQMLSSYLENLPYVKTIRQLTIEHIVQEGINQYTLGVFAGGEVIAPKSDWAILLPYDKNNIYFSSNAASFSTEAAIGNMELGKDFIIEVPEVSPALPPAVTPPDPEEKINAILVIKNNILPHE